jgi:hypothetical protein
MLGPKRAVGTHCIEQGEIEGRDERPEFFASGPQEPPSIGKKGTTVPHLERVSVDIRGGSKRVVFSCT